MFDYSSYFKLAHIGSLDHYASFLLAPATAKGSFWLCLYLKSKDLFYSKHLPMYSWAPFLCRTEEALQTLFWGRVLCSSLRVPVGLCYAHLPFQRHLLLSHVGWGCSLFGIVSIRQLLCSEPLFLNVVTLLPT